MCVQVGEEGVMDLKQSQQVVCFKVLCFSSQVTMWRMSWEKRLVPSPCTSESSPGNLPSGSAWKRSACEAVKAMISILRLQLAPRICTLGLVGLSQFSLSPPSEGLPDSFRLCWAARRQGLVCVNDMWAWGPGVDSPRVDQWHAVCQSSPRGSSDGLRLFWL